MAASVCVATGMPRSSTTGECKLSDQPGSVRGSQYDLVDCHGMGESGKVRPRRGEQPKLEAPREAEALLNLVG